MYPVPLLNSQKNMESKAEIRITTGTAKNPHTARTVMDESVAYLTSLYKDL
jgi:hypothetical protein